VSGFCFITIFAFLPIYGIGIDEQHKYEGTLDLLVQS